MTNDQSDKTFYPSRRGFLGVAAATGAASLGPGALIGAAATTTPLAEASEPACLHSVDAPVPGYLSFGPDEAGFLKVMVKVVCPADTLTPGRVACGLAAYIDRQLAGDFGEGVRLYTRGLGERVNPNWAISCRSHPRNFSSGPRCRGCGLPETQWQGFQPLPVQCRLQPDRPARGDSRFDSATTSTITSRGRATSDPNLKKGRSQ